MELTIRTPETHPVEFQKAHNHIAAIINKQKKFISFYLIYGDGRIYAPLTKEEVKCLYETMKEMNKLGFHKYLK